MTRFMDDGLEAAFQTRYEIRFWQNFRAVAVCGILFCAGIPVFQRLAWPGRAPIGMLALSVIPALLLTMFLSKFEPYLRLVRGHTQPLSAALFALAFIAVDGGAAFYFPDYFAVGRIHVILCYVVVLHVALRLQFLWSVAAASAVTLASIGFQFALGAPNYRLIATVILTHALGSALSWSLESFFRRDFLAKTEAEHAARKLQAVSAHVTPVGVATGLHSVADLAVLFSDLVGFTVFSCTVSPAQLIATLNRINEKFDAEADRLGVTKIKTLGDASVYVSGLTGPIDSRALRQLGASMLTCLGEANRELGCQLQIRIGLGRGPATVGVVGKTRRRFDVWGDAIAFAEEAQKAAAPGEVKEAVGYASVA